MGSPVLMVNVNRGVAAIFATVVSVSNLLPSDLENPSRVTISKRPGFARFYAARKSVLRVFSVNHTEYFPVAPKIAVIKNNCNIYEC